MIAAALLLAAVSGDPIIGTSQGTSLCQKKPSACRHEHVVYRIRSIGHGRFKVVAQQEHCMGPLDLHLGASGRQLAGSNRDPSGLDHPWPFTVLGVA